MTLIADIPGAKAAYVGSRPVWQAVERQLATRDSSHAVFLQPPQRTPISSSWQKPTGNTGSASRLPTWRN